MLGVLHKACAFSAAATWWCGEGRGSNRFPSPTLFFSHSGEFHLDLLNPGRPNTAGYSSALGVFVAAGVSGKINVSTSRPTGLMSRTRRPEAHDKRLLARNEVVINVSRVLGPAVGGALLATSQWGACFLFNAANLHSSASGPLAFSNRRDPAAERRKGQVRKGLFYAGGSLQFRAVLVMAAASGAVFNLGVALMCDVCVFLWRRVRVDG